MQTAKTFGYQDAGTGQICLKTDGTGTVTLRLEDHDDRVACVHIKPEQIPALLAHLQRVAMEALREEALDKIYDATRG